MPTYLITGANRGIGLGLTTALLLRPSTTVLAAVRDPSHATAKSILTLPTSSDSRAILLKIDSAVPSDASTAIASLQTSHPDITAIDVVIANAGIAKTNVPAAITPLDELREHLEVNTVAPLALFQATWPLLQKAAAPKFVGVTSGLGSVADMEQMPMPVTAYGSSKAALNYIVRKIHFENEGLIAFPISPGWVQTDMGNTGARHAGQEAAPVTLQQSVDGILNKIDNATREKTSGTFVSFDEAHFNW